MSVDSIHSFIRKKYFNSIRDDRRTKIPYKIPNYFDLFCSHGKLIDGYAGSAAPNLRSLLFQCIHSIIIELSTLVTGLFLLIEPSHAGAHRQVTSNFKTKPRLSSLMVISPFLNRFFFQE